MAMGSVKQQPAQLHPDKLPSPNCLNRLAVTGCPWCDGADRYSLCSQDHVIAVANGGHGRYKAESADCLLAVATLYLAQDLLAVQNMDIQLSVYCAGLIQGVISPRTAMQSSAALGHRTFF